MNMTDNDKELAQSIWSYGKANGDNFHTMFHRYHTAKLEQAARGFDEWFAAYEEETLSHPSFDTRVLMGKAYQAGAASQQAKIAELIEENLALRTEVERLHRDCEAYLTMNTPIFQELQSEKEELQEEVERLKAEKQELFARSITRKAQLQSAQLAAKTLQEQRYELMGIAADVDAGKGFDVVCRRTLQRVIDNLSAPIDTSAADELLTKLATLEGTVTARNRGLDVELEINQSLRDQLTSVCNALEEARKALEYYAQYPSSRYSYAGTGTAKDALATIDALLGKEGEEK